jgi:hypothetical protein
MRRRPERPAGQQNRACHISGTAKKEIPPILHSKECAQLTLCEPLPPDRAQSRYHRNIVIENNRFPLFERQSIVAAYSVDGLAIRDNEIEFTSA